MHYILHPLNALLMIAMPIGLGFYLTRKFVLEWKLWWIGAFVFILSQVGHIPFNSLVLKKLFENYLPSLPQPWQIALVAIALGLSAGLFEEIARYLMYRFYTKDARSWRQGILLGAGHGGIEAIILGTLVLLTYINMVAYKEVDLSTIASIPANQLELARQQVLAYWTAPWYDILLGALERAFTIPFHIAASLLVMQAFTRRNIAWLCLAIAWHTLLDSGAVYAAQHLGAHLTEALLGVAALLNIGLIFLLRRPEPLRIVPETSPEIPASPYALSLPPIAENLENLEDTRYQ